MSGMGGVIRRDWPVGEAPELSSEVKDMAALPQTQVRCNECNRRLGDYVNEVTTGQVILELKCPKCGAPHTELIRNPHLPG
jgi:Zn finger protein HypA/HybF involved in hydrogenase expression